VFKIKSTHKHATLKSFICFFNEKGGLDRAGRAGWKRKRRKRARVNWLKKGKREIHMALRYF
jgi:hypothetical protein